MRVEVETSLDEHVCRLCGTTFAEGGIVEVDGKRVVDVEPIAHCFDSVSVSLEDLLILTLKELGYTVTVDGRCVSQEVSEELNYES